MPKFKSIKLRIIEGRKLKPFDTAKVLQEHEDKITAIAGTDTSQLGDITALQTTVGNSNSGLVKDVADAQTDITALETAIGDSNSGLVKDVADLQGVVGDSSTDNTLVKDVATLKTSKANSNHTHTMSNVSDLDTVEAVVTYSDDSTETLLLVVKDNS